jgi:hypothetical protein
MLRFSRPFQLLVSSVLTSVVLVLAGYVGVAGLVSAASFRSGLWLTLAVVGLMAGLTGAVVVFGWLVRNPRWRHAPLVLRGPV